MIAAGVVSSAPGSQEEFMSMAASLCQLPSNNPSQAYFSSFLVNVVLSMGFQAPGVDLSGAVLHWCQQHNSEWRSVAVGHTLAYALSVVQLLVSSGAAFNGTSTSESKAIFLLRLAACLPVEDDEFEEDAEGIVLFARRESLLSSPLDFFSPNVLRHSIAAIASSLFSF